MIGVGLNKTGTKTLAAYLRQLGFNHRSYDSNNTYYSPAFQPFLDGDHEALFALLNPYDSCEDWPWPVLFRELDERFPDARFVLTTRGSAEQWYRSLCNMAVRLGPFPLYEKQIYGSAMPQGHKAHYLDFYRRHNEAVRAHFADRPGKLLSLCWDTGSTAEELAAFLKLPAMGLVVEHRNASPKKVYAGDNRLLAELARIDYQWLRGPQAVCRRAVGRLRRLSRR